MAGTAQALGVLLLVGMTAVLGFLSPEPLAWAVHAWRLLAGAVAMAAATFITLARLGGVPAAARALLVAAAVGWLAEGIGLQGGWLFGGAYEYHPEVRPVLPGGVPVYIVLSWFVVCGLPVMLLRHWPVGKPWRLAGAAVGAIPVAACDLALDPISVSLGIWSWQTPGAYFGVPFGNFFGWWLVAAVILWASGGIGGHDRRPVPIRFDLAWSAANSLLLLWLSWVCWQRLGQILPVGLCLAVLLPFLIHWHRHLGRRISVWRSIHRETATP